MFFKIKSTINVFAVIININSRQVVVKERLAKIGKRSKSTNITFGNVVAGLPYRSHYSFGILIPFNICVVELAVDLTTQRSNFSDERS